MTTLSAKIETDGQAFGKFRLIDNNGKTLDVKKNRLSFSSQLTKDKEYRLYVTVTGQKEIKYKLNISGVSKHNHNNETEVSLSKKRDRYRIKVTA